LAKKIISLIIRFIVGFGILFILSLSFDLSDALKSILKSNFLWVSLGLIIILFLRIIVVVRWKIILQYQKLYVPFIELVKINYISSALGQVLPGGIGGDLLRGYKLNKKYKQISNTTASILLDRILGIGSMLLLSLIGSILADLIGLKLSISNYLLLICTLFILVFYLTSKLRLDYFNFRFTNNERTKRLLKKISDILISVTDFKKIRNIFPSVFLISLIIQLLRCMIFYFLYRAFGYDIDFIYFLIAIPITLVLAIIPISIAGLGIREGSLIYFFTTVGVPAETSIGVGILFHLLQILASLPGVLMWVFEKKMITRQ